MGHGCVVSCGRIDAGDVTVAKLSAKVLRSLIHRKFDDGDVNFLGVCEDQRCGFGVHDMHLDPDHGQPRSELGAPFVGPIYDKHGFLVGFHEWVPRGTNAVVHSAWSKALVSPQSQSDNRREKRAGVHFIIQTEVTGYRKEDLLINIPLHRYDGALHTALRIVFVDR